MKTRMLAALGLLLIAGQSGAITIGLQPTAQTAMPGDTVFLELTISGLTAGSAPTLGAFDIDIGFDDGALDFVTGAFGTSLGDETMGEALTLLDPGVGTINLAEVSLLSLAALDALQPDNFVLATLEFMVDVLSEGSSTVVSLSSVLLADNFGDSIMDFDTNDATITNPRVGVSEPASLLLWGLGIVLLSRRRLGRSTGRSTR